jgi:hypothetical protein
MNTELRSQFRAFQSHVVLLGVSPLMADDLLQEIGPLAGRHRRFVLDRLIVVQLRIELTAEDDVAGERAADFQLDRLGRVIADPLAVNLVIVPVRSRVRASAKTTNNFLDGRISRRYADRYTTRNADSLMQAF